MSAILVVEDEPALRHLLVRILHSGGYEVKTAASGTEAITIALGSPVDLVMLDLGLPDLAGEDVMRVLLAAKPDLRILVLSSSPEIGRRIAVLDGGAADFVSKPFANGELLARVRLRMAGGPTRPAAAHTVPIDGGAYLDATRRELVVDAERIPLSTREFDLLCHLARRRGATCTRQELLSDVWGLAFDPGTNVVDVYIGRLRSKLAGARIETVRNVGYRLTAS